MLAGPTQLLSEFQTPNQTLSVPPRALPLPGPVRSFTAECDAQTCRFVVNLAVAGRAELWGFSLGPERAFAPSRLAVLGGPASQTLSPLLLGSDLFFVDQRADAATRRLERLRLQF